MNQTTNLVIGVVEGYNLKSMNIILILTFLIGLPTFKSDLRNIGDAKLAKEVLMAGGFPFILSFSFDRGIETEIQSFQYNEIRNYFNFTNELGGKLAIGSIALGYFISVGSGNEKLKDFSLTSLESMALAGGTTLIIKILLGRARPSTLNSPYEFKPINFDDSYQALPSGHTTIAFAWLTVFANYYGSNPILRYGAYALATSAAIARVYKNRHWFSDCVLGAMIGYYFGKRLSDLHLKEGGKL